MTDIEEQNTEETARQEEVSSVLPALAQLDSIASELEAKQAAGQEVSAADVGTYIQQAALARHLVAATGATPAELKAAEKEHRVDGSSQGFAARGLDHATHTRNVEPNPAADRDRDDEEIGL